MTIEKISSKNNQLETNQSSLFQKHQQEIQETKNKLAEQEAQLMGAVKSWQKGHSIGKWEVKEYSLHGSTLGASRATKELYMEGNLIYEFSSHTSTEASPMGTMLDLILIQKKPNQHQAP